MTMKAPRCDPGCCAASAAGMLVQVLDHCQLCHGEITGIHLGCLGFLMRSHVPQPPGASRH